MADDQCFLDDPPDPRTFERCHLVNAPVVAKDATHRQARGGWQYARCLNCPATLWIPKGGDYTLPDVCRKPQLAPDGGGLE